MFYYYYLFLRIIVCCWNNINYANLIEPASSEIGLKVYPVLKSSVSFELFYSFFNNKTLNVPHDTTFCMKNNAKTLIIHGYKYDIT